MSKHFYSVSDKIKMLSIQYAFQLNQKLKKFRLFWEWDRVRVTNSSVSSCRLGNTEYKLPTDVTNKVYLVEAFHWPCCLFWSGYQLNLKEQKGHNTMIGGDNSKTRSPWVVQVKQLTKICSQLMAPPPTTDFLGKEGTLPEAWSVPIECTSKLHTGPVYWSTPTFRAMAVAGPATAANERSILLVHKVAFTLVRFTQYASWFHNKINIFASLNRNDSLCKTDQCERSLNL